MARMPSQAIVQPSLPGFCQIEDAIDHLSKAGIEARGAIFTRREVVDFILDLVGYQIDAPLYHMRLLEPSFGNGDFLLPAVQRLMEAYQRYAQHHHVDVTLLSPCLRAVELHSISFDETYQALLALLQSYGVSQTDADVLAACWLIEGDFLLTDFSEPFTHVIGNPPYLRQEIIPDALLDAYRSRFETLYDRADIYVPFIEKSLDHLAQNGALGFICSDRWMKNRYGGPLRHKVAERFRLKFYIDMVNTPAFHRDVIAYPAITVITNEKPAPTRIAHQPDIEPTALAELATELLCNTTATMRVAVQEVPGGILSSEPWIFESFDQLEVARRLERDFPTIEEAGCKVGIGVATGADKAFIGPFDELDVEPDRKLPLAMTRDILTGEVVWRGLGVINPFAHDGSLVDLGRHPKLASYLNARKEALCRRHVAKKNLKSWYRTIDRIDPELAGKPKLLIPDIKGEAHIVYESGQLYPHHNLYYITSVSWDLKALQAVLRSGIAHLFVSIYSTKMRGGYLRFQAQYLRRIRLPRWTSIPSTIKADLIEAAESNDRQRCYHATARLYELSDREKAILSSCFD